MGSIKMAKAGLREQNWPSDANRVHSLQEE